MWQKKFNNYLEAVGIKESYNDLEFREFKGGFDSREWINRQESMFGLAAKGELPRSSSIFEFLGARPIQNIVDFGGGPGWIWAYLVKSKLHGEISYYNLELDTSRIAFNYLTQEFPRMKFLQMNEVSSLKGYENFLYCNSVLQYFENNSALLKLITDLSPSIIVLDDVAGNEEEFFSLQNYYGFLQVNRFLNLNKLISEVVGLGYKLTVNRPYEKRFSATMIPKIWIGPDECAECEAPSSVTLVFYRI